MRLVPDLGILFRTIFGSAEFRPDIRLKIFLGVKPYWIKSLLIRDIDKLTRRQKLLTEGCVPQAMPGAPATKSKDLTGILVARADGAPASILATTQARLFETKGVSA